VPAAEIDTPLVARSFIQGSGFTDQEIIVELTSDGLSFQLPGTRTQPIVFSPEFKDDYLAGLDGHLENWDRYARDAVSNTEMLPNLPTRDGYLGLSYFIRLADGTEFSDGQARIRFLACGPVNLGCLRSQVQFYTRNDLAEMRRLIESFL
jgi:hypothetical protein